MSNVESRKPKIRFKGFTDPWEQRKLGEVADRYDNLRIPITASERVPGSTPYYGANGIQDYVEGFTHQGEFVLIAEDGASDLDNYPTMCINGTIWVNNHAHVIQGRKGLTDNHFVAWSIKRCDIKPMLTGGTRAKLNAEVLMGMGISTPNYAEQISIGSFFEQLDHLITLHQRKLTALKNVKKSLLEKMFPKPGEFVPEIRFKGFTDPWEQRKLGELYEKNDERNAVGFGADRTLSIATMTLNDEGNGAAEESLPNYKVIRVGDVAFEGHTNKEFAYGRFVVNDLIDGIMSPRFTCLRPKHGYPVSLWKYYIHSEQVMRETLVRATKSGTMMNELVLEDLFKQPILVPPASEQELIGSFFSRLDSLITLHQRKLTALKNVKKSLLEKMFV